MQILKLTVLAMITQKVVPSSAKSFIETGIELVSCIISQDTFTTDHIAIRIKDYSHQFGKNCLEQGLRQKEWVGTCPICRGVLFRASNSPGRGCPVRQVPPGILPPMATPDASVSPARCIECYEQASNVNLSAQHGFLSRLWSGITHPLPGDQKTHAVRAIRSSSEKFPGSEYNVLVSYISRISSVGLEATWSTCPITSLYHTLAYLARCCQAGFTISLATWQIIMRYHIHIANDTLHWLDIRNDVWTLHELHREDRPTGEHWRILHLFFIFMVIHYSHQLLPMYGAKEIRELICILGCEDSFGTLAQDYATRGFLLAAMHVLRLSRIFDEPCWNARGLRLLSGNTSILLLKQDVEALWLEGIKLGAKEMSKSQPRL